MEKFEFVGNRVFDDRPTAFLPQSAQPKPGAEFFSREVLNTGVKVLENGDVTFGFYAPNAKKVSVIFGLKPQEPLEMVKGENGVFTATLPYDPLFKGPKAYHFDVDGAEAISPYCPIYFSHDKAINYVEIPDSAADAIFMRDIPHGSVAIEYYYSEALEDWVRCLVYLPPEYEKGGEYPVLYLQHGAGENETSWVFNGKANHIMDNLIADGKIKPFIVVMNNGMVRGKNESFMLRNEVSAFEKTLTESCIAFIEKKYRVLKDKEHRAIAGFSMGSMQSCTFGLKHPELFSYVGLLSGFMTMGTEKDHDKVFENYPHLKAMEDKEQFVKDHKLFYRAIGSMDAHVEPFWVDDAFCHARGYYEYPNFVSKVFEGYPHDWAVLRLELADFATYLFKD